MGTTTRWECSIEEPSFAEALAAFKDAQATFIGKKIEIVSEYFNGQPHGHSKPKLKGTVTTIEAVHFDMYWGISFRLKNDDNWCYIGIDGVKFLG